ncbi:cupin domain-containing protein [Dactylosporangium sp. CA-092794]|uniref:cupin domain-containing protein n=1 Tax=Dactylosporangium sp. CA-092794 TaxID=3239929 RepID=UPI003D8FE230
MTKPKMLAPGEGRLIAGGGLHATLKVAGGSEGLTSTFEVVVPPGYDVGAHVHTMGEELFYVVEGELDLLALEPTTRSGNDWHEWVAPDGHTYMRGGPGAMLFVPAGCPHAFANPTDKPAKMLFQAAPSGHEDYFQELADFLRASNGPPDQEELGRIRRRHDIEQLTPFRGGTPLTANQGSR